MKNIILFVAVALCCAFAHPFYLGVVDLKYNIKEKALQGSVKLFTSDLEDALRKIHKQQVDLIHPVDRTKTQKILEDYLKKRFFISVNNVTKGYDVLGFEQEQEATWIYIEIKNCLLPGKISLESGLLYDFIQEQTNIFHLEVNGVEKSFKLNNPEKKVDFTF